MLTRTAKKARLENTPGALNEPTANAATGLSLPPPPPAAASTTPSAPVIPAPPSLAALVPSEVRGGYACVVHVSIDVWIVSACP
jgi:hypothetical protein